MDYVYVKPGVLGTEGFAYGKGKVLTGRSPSARISHVTSGRWEALPPLSSQLLRASFQHRVVSEAEALSGIGTYIGSCVCVSRVREHAARAWAYGVVVGFEWHSDAGGRRRLIVFGDKTKLLRCEASDLHEVETDVFALRPCADLPVVDIMPGEVRSIHQLALDAFNGVAGPATRDSSSIRQQVNAFPIDEAQCVPIYRLNAGSVVLLSVKHILDFLFYKVGNRPAPRDVTFGATIYDHGLVNPTSSPTASIRLPYRLRQLWRLCGDRCGR